MQQSVTSTKKFKSTRRKTDGDSLRSLHALRSHSIQYFIFISTVMCVKSNGKILSTLLKRLNLVVMQIDFIHHYGYFSFIDL